MKTTDENCRGCCRCPNCGVTAYWSPRLKRHACADPDCATEFADHDDSQFEDDDDTDGDWDAPR